MNERIKHLIEQCTEKITSYTYSRGNFTETYFDKQKFVELIVKECVGRVRYCIQNDVDFIAEDIKKHFGVE